MLFIGNPINGTPTPWKEGIKIESTLTNAYEIFRKPSLLKKISNSHTIHKILDFDGIVMMDSGGFQFQKHSEIKVEIDQIIDIQKKSKADINVILDHPLDLSKGLEENERRIKTTLENTEIYLNNFNKSELLPVIQGYSVERIKSYIKELKDIWGDEPSKVGIGGLVQIMKSFNKTQNEFYTNNHTSSKNHLIDLVLTVRKELPDTFIHVFGVGASITSMYILFTIGIDSVDSVAWRLQAAGGKIALPRIGSRKLRTSTKSWARTLTEDEWINYNCECPVCSSMRFVEIQNSWNLMAKHNLWIYFNEMELIKKAMSEGNFIELAEKRAKVTGFYSMFKYAREQVNGSCQKNLDI